MHRSSGFTLIEILVVVFLFLIITTLSIITLNPHRRQVKTEDAAGSVFSFMRQARIQAVTRRQFYAVVINTAATTQTVPINNSTKSIKFLPQSVSLVDMGSITLQNDEEITLSKKFPIDVVINAASGLPSQNALPIPERNFPIHNFSSSNPTGTYICYFDPAGRSVSRADGAGVQEYRTFYFSSPDITVAKSAPLLRAITIYGATGGLRFWRYQPTPTPQWQSQAQ